MMESNSSNFIEGQSHSTLKPLDDNEKNVILCNLIVRCRNETRTNRLYKPLSNYVERVAYYTGIRKLKIHEFITAKNLGEIEYENKYFELPHRLEVMKSIIDLCNKGLIPTNKNIYVLLHRLFNNFLQFQYKMSCLGYEHRFLESGEEILIEDPDLTFERYLYIKQISEFKSKCAPIYYIDERFIDISCTFPKPWMKNIDVSSRSCDGYVFFHAVSRKGFQNGLYCSPTTKTDFIKWLTNILMPQFLEPSIIIMDSNYLHKPDSKAITKYDTRENMLQYLRRNNIPCNENLHKAELYKLIKNCSPKLTMEIDEIVKAHGHQVLWLPTTFPDLSITHFLWEYLAKVKSIETNKPLHTLKTTLIEKLINIPCSVWHSFNENVSDIEKQIYDIDAQIYKVLETKYTFRDSEM